MHNCHIGVEDGDSALPGKAALFTKPQPGMLELADYSEWSPATGVVVTVLPG
jgi:hypothetical protein